MFYNTYRMYRQRWPLVSTFQVLFTSTGPHSMTRTGPNDAGRVVWVLSFYLFYLFITLFITLSITFYYLFYCINIIIYYINFLSCDCKHFLGFFLLLRIWSYLSRSEQNQSDSEQFWVELIRFQSELLRTERILISSAQIWWESAKYWFKYQQKLHNNDR